MSDPDNLRNRIAECQRQVLKRRAPISDVDLPDYLAQAIIDEFGLTVEYGAAFSEFDIRSVMDHDDAEETARWNPGMYPVSRIVGKWEKQ